MGGAGCEDVGAGGGGWGLCMGDLQVWKWWAAGSCALCCCTSPCLAVGWRWVLLLVCGVVTYRGVTRAEEGTGGCSDSLGPPGGGWGSGGCSAGEV